MNYLSKHTRMLADLLPPTSPKEDMYELMDS